MRNYKLLTPGPLTTTDTVKQVMMFDHCTWDDDYKQITQKIRRELLELAHVTEEEYTGSADAGFRNLWSGERTQQRSAAGWNSAFAEQRRLR